jgi:hypothetical protein
MFERSRLHQKTEVPGHRLYLDLSKVTVKSGTSINVTINSDNWKVLVCKATGKKWSDFTVMKSDMLERTCEHLHKLKTHGIPVRYLRLDPAGKNQKLAKHAGSSDWAILQPIDFEFTSQDTPQHNSLAELVFPYLVGKARAMMGGAMVPENMKSKVALEAISCATQLDGLVVVKIKGKLATPDMQLFGVNPTWSKKLRVWGEVGVVAEGKDSKTGDRGATMMFVGYAKGKRDSVRMWDSRTARVIVSRDVIWLRRMFFKNDMTGVTNLDTFGAIEDDSGLESGAGSGSVDGSDIINKGPTNNQPFQLGGRVTWASPLVNTPSDVRTTQSGRIIWTPDRLMYALAVELRYLGEMAELDKVELANMHISLRSMELALIGAGVCGGIRHTSKLKVLNYKKAMRSPDAEEWCKEIRNEKARFDKYNALTAVLRRLLPKGAKVLMTTWAMKLKLNGIWRGRLNARGYEQVDGSHYASDSIAAPVTIPITV